MDGKKPAANRAMGSPRHSSRTPSHGAACCRHLWGGMRGDPLALPGPPQCTRSCLPIQLCVSSSICSANPTINSAHPLRNRDVRNCRSLLAVPLGLTIYQATDPTTASNAGRRLIPAVSIRQFPPCFHFSACLQKIGGHHCFMVLYYAFAFSSH